MAINKANDTLTRYPSLYQINTRVWPAELSLVPRRILGTRSKSDYKRLAH